MKKLFFSMTALVCSAALFAQTDVKTTAAPQTSTVQPATTEPAQTGKKAADVANFASETVDLGKIKKDNPSTALFTVTNVSKEPLIIEQANPTCGCTISDYTKEPIAPGKTGTIKATYNAKNVGAFEKHLTVKFAGVDEIKSITLKGEVMADESAATTAPSKADPSVKAAITPAPAMDAKATPAKATAKKVTTTATKKTTSTSNSSTAPKS